MRPVKKYTFWFVGFAMLGVGSLALSGPLFSTPREFFIASPDKTDVADLPAPLRPTATLLFMGDVMLGRGVAGTVRKYGDGDFTFPFQPIKDFLSDADFRVANLEGPLTDQGQDLDKPYILSMPPAAMAGLVFAGFDALSLANNHAEDRGREGLADTASRLRAAGIAYAGVGTEANVFAPARIMKNGLTVSVLAFSDFDTFQPTATAVGVARAMDEKVTEAVKAAKRPGEPLVVLFHFGEEYAAAPTARQQALAHLAVQNGADIVIGSHPHVVQSFEKYQGKLIAYSLGNLLFDQYFSTSTMSGAVLKVTVAGDTIEQAELFDTVITGKFQVELAGSGSRSIWYNN